MWIYLSIFLFAIIEGEIYYITMCVLASAGRLQWEGVLIAGALGGSAGDQFWFYLLRGRIHWLDRYPWLARHRDAVVHRVKANETLIVLISRFLPIVILSLRKRSISPSNAIGSITTPFPITQTLPRRRIPEGIRWRMYLAPR